LGFRFIEGPLRHQLAKKIKSLGFEIRKDGIDKLFVTTNHLRIDGVESFDANLFLKTVGVSTIYIKSENYIEITIVHPFLNKLKWEWQGTNIKIW